MIALARAMRVVITATGAGIEGFFARTEMGRWRPGQGLWELTYTRIPRVAAQWPDGCGAWCPCLNPRLAAPDASTIHAIDLQHRPHRARRHHAGAEPKPRKHLTQVFL
ncbi:hypothetical protein D3C71_1827920 [compost metagenome]